MIVHDYEGIGAWMEERWQRKDPVVAAMIEACWVLVKARPLSLTFQLQQGHQSSWAGRDHFAYWNGRVDRLAVQWQA